MSEVRSEPSSQPVGRPHWAVFLGLAALVFVADQLTKAWLVSILAPGESRDVVGDLLRIVYSQNNGGLFGLFHGQALIFGLVSLVVVGGIVVAHGRLGDSRYLSITLGLLLGGALGNLIDRVAYGEVIDFADAHWGALHWPAFNVADACISVGVCWLLLRGIFVRDDRQSEAQRPAAA